MVMHRRWSQNGRLHSGDTGGDTSWSPVRSPGTELFEWVELYFGDGLEMAGHLVLTLEGTDSAESLLRSPGAEFLKFVEVYLGQGLLMAGFMVMTCGRRESGWSLLWSPEASKDILGRKSL